MIIFVNNCSGNIKVIGETDTFNGEVTLNDFNSGDFRIE